MSGKEPRFHGEVTEKSHKNMSRIRAKDTSIEVALRKAFGVKDIDIVKIIKNCQEDQILYLQSIK